MTRRALDISALVVLSVAAAYTALVVFSFAQSRFFTIDEYQYGHATWLVAQGQLPYVDFFEHHFPLSYVLHAPLYWQERPFDEAALLLRRIVFGSWLALCVLTVWAARRVTGDRLAALLLGFLPVGFGFSLMSAIDYRADNFGAIYFGACLVLLEWNRSARRRGVAVACGLLLAVSAAMTQKMAFVGGCTLALLLAGDWARRRFASAEHEPFVAHAVWLVAAAVALALAGIAVAGVLGILPAGFEATILQAAEHEKYYEPFSVFGQGYVEPFWEATWPATLPTLLLAAGFLVTREGRFWLAPTLAAGLAAYLVAAPYPYNFVLLCWLVVVAAVRGFAGGLAWLAERFPALEEVSPLLYLLPLAALSLQLRFVANTSSNEHQLAVLRKIEAHGSPGDAVIDNAGGAMFSPHASYYYLHGVAHRKMFRDYFENHLVDDYRRSQALFWIRDGRFKGLPKAARDYLHRHYVHGGDGLYVLGTRTPSTRGGEQALGSFSVVRAAEYRFHPTTAAGSANGADTDLQVGGRAPVGGRLFLEPGEYPVRVRADAPAYIIAPVDASFFDDDPQPPRYTMMFEYEEGREPVRQLAHDLLERFPTASERDGAELAAGRLEQRPGSRLVYHLALPDAPRLRAHVDLRGKAPPQGRLVVEIRSPERRDVLVSEPVGIPLRHPGLTIDASLALYAGRMVELSLRFEAEPGDRHLSWTRLQIEDLIDPESEEGEQDGAAIPRGPANVLWVLFDTLRADRTEPYGSQRTRTPSLSRLAERGTTFLDTQANASWTAPSVASLLSSVYPSVHGISGTGWSSPEEARVNSLREELPYLPAILSGAGYRTVAIVKNPFFHQAFGFGRGFDEMHGLYAQQRQIREQHPTPEGQADAVWDEFVAPLVGPGQPPFFVYLHELDPHQPYDPLPPYDELYPSDWQGDRALVRRRNFGFVYKRRPEVLSDGGVAYLNAQYDGEVSFMDAYLGRLLERLEAAGLEDETLVVFVSDHGESLTEHGLVGHGARLYEEVLRVPLILSLPGRLPQGLRVESPVEGIDVPVTVLDLLGLDEKSRPAGLQGRSLVPLMEGRDARAPRPRFAQARFGQLYSYDSIRYGDWKLIRRNPSGEDAAGAEPSYELFDLESDPHEAHDRFAEQPIVGNTLREMLEWRQHLDAALALPSTPASARAPEVDAQTRENLEALGYVTPGDPDVLEPETQSR